MPKNIVICCDGTANEFAKHNTNVVKLGVKQVWFPGVHCDVGGGYPESESGALEGRPRVDA
jgi:hypothetical protein